MDHYAELVVAHAIGPGGRAWADRIELELLNAALLRHDLEIDLDGAPAAPPEARAVDQWEAALLLDDGEILWMSQCEECGGTGIANIHGKYKSETVDCPWCDDVEDICIVTDAYGTFVRMADHRERV